jgi:hypothetical protein
VVTLYRWLICLYPQGCRDKFREEMTSVFRDAQSALPPALASKVSFYLREYCGLLSGALRAHLDRLSGPSVPSGTLDTRAQFHFSRASVALRDSGPDRAEVVPFGPYGFGLLRGHPVGLVILLGLLFMGLVGIPEARWFFAGAIVLGTLCGFFLWLRHR